MLRSANTWARVVGWTNVLLGVWLAAAPFLVGYGSIRAALWNGVINGTVIALVAALRLAGVRRPLLFGVLLACVALWLVLAPLVFSYYSAAMWSYAAGQATWNGIFVGGLALALGAVHRSLIAEGERR